MSVLERRLQILLDPAQYERLEAEARRRSLSVGATVRAAIEMFLDDDVQRRDAAKRALLAMESQGASGQDFDKDSVLLDAFPG
ncbi:MAG: ribbon-helix-helix protein, CopG family [Actinobacteria bacterium]|nr:ribbon-helix-helix protein, CopG family [Actinomycetota bacterium]